MGDDGGLMIEKTCGQSWQNMIYINKKMIIKNNEYEQRFVANKLQNSQQKSAHLDDPIDEL